MAWVIQPTQCPVAVTAHMCSGPGTLATRVNPAGTYRSPLTRQQVVVEHMFDISYRDVMAGTTSRETESDTPCDGTVCYRAIGYGGRSVVLPATCRRRLHQLGVTGYRATEGGGMVRVRCDACASHSANASAWVLRTHGPVANHAELDDSPYAALLANLVAQPLPL